MTHHDLGIQGAQGVLEIHVLQEIQDYHVLPVAQEYQILEDQDLLYHLVYLVILVDLEDQRVLEALVSQEGPDHQYLAILVVQEALAVHFAQRHLLVLGFHQIPTVLEHLAFLESQNLLLVLVIPSVLLFLGDPVDPAIQTRVHPFALESLAVLVFHLTQLFLVCLVALVAQEIQENLLDLLAQEAQCLVLQDLLSFL